MTTADVAAERRPTVVVTGASSGIGAAVARRLAERWHVVLGARRVESCREIAQEISGLGGQATALALDLRDAGSVAAFAEQTAALGPLQAVVSNAGYNQPARAVAATDEDLLAHLEVNLLGAQRLSRALSPSLLDRGRGDLIFVSSDVVMTHRPGTAPYNASKAALEGLVRTLQHELEGSGVRASLVRPGPTWTEMGMDWPEAATTELLQDWVRFGLARHSGFLQPANLAHAVAFLVDLPVGMHVPILDVQPEAPVKR